MTLTRRSLLAATALATMLPATGALAQSFSAADLLRPGTLPEKVVGKADAPVTIIEYSSMTCGHCATFHTDTYPKLKSQYIDTGKVRFIYREFPLDNAAMAASMVARCMPEANFYPMVDALFTAQRQWAFTNDPYSSLLTFARQAGFTQESFDACLKNQSLLDGLSAQRARGSKEFGIDSTPTFFINGKKQRGALSFDEFAKLIDPLIKG